MALESVPTISAHFGELQDPRVLWRVTQPLINLLVIAICALICGALWFIGNAVTPVTEGCYR